MIKDLFSGIEKKSIDLSEELISEIVILHSLGVSVDDLNYLLEMRLYDE